MNSLVDVACLQQATIALPHLQYRGNVYLLYRVDVRNTSCSIPIVKILCCKCFCSLQCNCLQKYKCMWFASCDHFCDFILAPLPDVASSVRNSLYHCNVPMLVAALVQLPQVQYSLGELIHTYNFKGDRLWQPKIEKVCTFVRESLKIASDKM